MIGSCSDRSIAGDNLKLVILYICPVIQKRLGQINACHN